MWRAFVHPHRCLFFSNHFLWEWSLSDFQAFLEDIRQEYTLKILMNLDNPYLDKEVYFYLGWININYKFKNYLYWFLKQKFIFFFAKAIHHDEKEKILIFYQCLIPNQVVQVSLFSHEGHISIFLTMWHYHFALTSNIFFLTSSLFHERIHESSYNLIKRKAKKCLCRLLSIWVQIQLKL